MGGPYPLPGKESNGGAQEVTYVLANTLAKLDMKLSVLTRSNEITKDFKHQENNVDFHYFATRRPKLISSLARDIPALRKKIKKIDPDIVHAQTPEFAYCSLKENYPTVLTLHSMVWKEAKYYPGIHGWARRIIYPKLLDSVFGKLKYLIMISPYVEKEVKGRTDAKRFLIENPINERFFNIVNTENENRILYVGVIRKIKNAFALVKAIHLIPDEIEFNLILGGKIDEKIYGNKLDKYLEDNNLKSNVNLIGHLNKRQLVSEYSKMSFLCLPSKHETAPMVISEAMASGKPVIASNICGIPHMVAHGETGYLIEPEDIHGIAESIQKLLLSKKLRNEMGRKAKEEAKRKWHPDVVAEKTLQVYRQIVRN